MIGVDYANRLKAADEPKKIADVQKWFRESLEQFVKDFPNTDETPEARPSPQQAGRPRSAGRSGTAVGASIAMIG